MIFSVRHHTAIRYASPVSGARFNLRLQPYPWRGQLVLEEDMQFDPAPSLIDRRTGPYLVNTTRAEFAGDIARLAITSSFTVEVVPPVLANDGPPLAELRQAALASDDLSTLSPAPYLFASRIALSDAGIGAWAQEHCSIDVPVLQAALELSSRLHSEFAYTPGTTTSKTAPADAFAHRHGVCQDFAHVLIIALRWLGIPAAYASGYLRTLPPPGQERLVGADAMHAWVNVWAGEELGWVGIDPTNDCLTRDSHIQIAMGRDYADVAPIDGTFVGNAPQSMVSSVDVVETSPAD